MCGFETKVRQTGAALERSGVGHCGIIRLLTVCCANVQEVQAYRALKLTKDNSYGNFCRLYNRRFKAV
jgi:hypothetical protein